MPVAIELDVAQALGTCVGVESTASFQVCAVLGRVQVRCRRRTQSVYGGSSYGKVLRLGAAVACAVLVGPTMTAHDVSVGANCRERDR